jgi:NADPH-dependent curcumin reductase CurA
MTLSRQIVLRRRPRGLPLAEDFEIVSQPMPVIAAGEAMIRTLYCSLDPAMRRWMDEDSYSDPIPLGAPLRCLCLGQVQESRNKELRSGDLLLAMGTVGQHSIVPEGRWFSRVEPSGHWPLSRYLSLFGLNGMTAYFGLLDIGRPQPGETVLVSGAAGSVGSLVGQIAKINGCHTVGVAGGARKCRRLIEEFSFDAAIDYRNRTLAQLTADVWAACPQGVDIYFDNVGGVVLDAALAAINDRARLVECGMISLYNLSERGAGPSNIWQIIAKRATMRGFLGREYLDRFPEAIVQLRSWAREGRIQTREHVDVGLERFHEAFLRLFDGSNEGKLMLKIADPDQGDAAGP